MNLMQPARQKDSLADSHASSNHPHKASRDIITCCFMFSDIQVWEKHEAYTKISEANTCFRISLLQRIHMLFHTSLDPLSPSALNFPDSVGALALTDVVILLHMSWCKTRSKVWNKICNWNITLSCCSQFPQDNKSNFSFPPSPFVSDPLSFIAQ